MAKAGLSLPYCLSVDWQQRFGRPLGNGAARLTSIAGEFEDARRIRADVGVTEAEISRLAQADEKVAQQPNGRQIVKIIVVPQELINIVVK
jgi:leucyl-tRNA synthetase